MMGRTSYDALHFLRMRPSLPSEYGRRFPRLPDAGCHQWSAPSLVEHRAGRGVKRHSRRNGRCRRETDFRWEAPRAELFETHNGEPSASYGSRPVVRCNAPGVARPYRRSASCSLRQDS